MARETKADKAVRYLAEGRIIVRHVTPEAVAAVVRGEGSLYRVRSSLGAWTCTCPHQANSADCSHVLALKRITAVDLENGRRPA